MNCDDARHLLHLTRPGERTEDEERSLDKHLHICPACQKEAEQISRLVDAMDRIVQTPPPPVHAGNETRRIMESIRSGQESRSGLADVLLSLSDRPVFRMAYGIAALVTLAVMGYQLAPPDSEMSGSPPRTGPYVAYRVEASAAEQIRDLPLPDAVRRELPPEGTIEISQHDMNRTAALIGQAMLRSLSLTEDERRYAATMLTSIVRAAEPTIRFGKIGG